ncbi:hypothetical protein [Asticcacaulis sp. AND118]|uniref:hypothetical protein n=1 Tax=Asticcacaulis sp. AND118 TaxID=2840468 RepID=UPI001D001220|nr:hypothetical protein [Asticcacaulis sp. AND118]UDF03720.1 hypothetical protein LH365_01365 [Asticcacaulis sp. AND118]
MNETAEELKELIRSAASQLRRTLSVKQSADDFSAIVDEANSRLGYQLIGTPQTGFYKEAFLASRFAPLRQATHVWLGDDPPDFWLTVEGQDYSFEATEVLRPNRKRDIELREVHELGPQMDPAENWLTISENIDLVIKAIARKNKPKYSTVFGLLIYLNTGSIDHESGCDEATTEIVKTLRQSNFPTPFQQVWLALNTYCERIR